MSFYLLRIVILSACITFLSSVYDHLSLKAEERRAYVILRKRILKHRLSIISRILRREEMSLCFVYIPPHPLNKSVFLVMCLERRVYH